MKFLVYSINYSPELTGIGKYNGEMSKWLVKNDVAVQVVAGKPYYPNWKVHVDYLAFGYQASIEEGVSVIRCPLYVPANPSVLKRIIHLASFALSSMFVLLKKAFSKNTRPDVIFVVQPTLFITPVALLFAKITGAKTVLHIQDYEVDAMLGLGMAGKGSTIPRIAHSIESWLMRRFDLVSTISYSMMEKAKQKGISAEKVIFFPNWADTDFVTPEADCSAMREAWGFAEDDIIVLYAGNIGVKQGLEIVLEAVAQYQSQSYFKFTGQVNFVFVGAGAHVNALKQQAVDMKLKNVIFKPLQPWEDLPAVLAMADLHLVVQKKGAADAVLPSKLTNILSAGGNAIVTAEKNTELGQLIVKFPGIYTLAEPESLSAFIQALNVELSRINVSRSGYNFIAREYAEQHLNKNAILSEFLDNVRQLIR
jgi:colanic acid biosynthesis glycosyl transferase WcaI